MLNQLLEPESAQQFLSENLPLFRSQNGHRLASLRLRGTYADASGGSSNTIWGSRRRVLTALRCASSPATIQIGKICPASLADFDGTGSLPVRVNRYWSRAGWTGPRKAC